MFMASPSLEKLREAVMRLWYVFVEKYERLLKIKQNIKIMQKTVCLCVSVFCSSKPQAQPHQSLRDSFPELGEAKELKLSVLCVKLTRCQARGRLMKYHFFTACFFRNAILPIVLN